MLLDEQQSKNARILWRSKTPMACSYEGPCVKKARRIHPGGISLCLADDWYVRNFGCDFEKSS